MSLRSGIWYPFALAAVSAAILTPLVIWVARRLGVVARPRADRWHQRPTALLGGVAIYLASVGAAALILAFEFPPEREAQVRLFGLWAAATLVFALGLLDDLRRLSPSIKIVGQTVAACLLVMYGIRITSTSLVWLAVPLTIFWVVGITNAVNLLDNMDGVAAGVMAIAALSMAATGAAVGQLEVRILALALAGACCGYLLYNFHPARIFMGDCGSLYLGFTISALALAGTTRQASGLTVALLVPVAVLAIPIFDTTLVAIARRLHGRPVSQGGRDHTTHRLVALGLSERAVALLLYAGSALLSALALSAARLPILAVLTLAALVLLALGLIGTFLGMVQVYPVAPHAASAPEASIRNLNGRGAPGKSVTPLNGNRIAKRVLARVMLDVALVPLAFAIAHLLRFEAAIPASILRRGMELLPVCIAAKMVAMVACRTHSGLWRYASVADVIATVKGSSLGSLVILAIIAVAGKFSGLSRTVFIIDWLVFTALALTVRGGFVLLRQLFSTLPPRGLERVVVVGADDGGLAAVWQLRHSRTRRPVGFVDDDETKHRSTLEGLPVLGGIEDLPRLVRQSGAQTVLIPPQATGADRVVALCGSFDIPWVRGIGLRSLEGHEEK